LISLNASTLVFVVAPHSLRTVKVEHFSLGGNALPSFVSVVNETGPLYPTVCMGDVLVVEILCINTSTRRMVRRA
jgi:hypothetical protein